MTRPRQLILAIMVGLLIQAPGSPQTSEDTVNKELIEAALKLTKDATGKYAIELQSSERREVELVPEPILRWSNPQAGEIHGNVFLWTVNDRPAVVGSLFKWFSPHTHMSHEFHSLADMPLKTRYEGKEIWTTREPGVQFAVLPSTPPPASSATQRLLQMRRFAKDFAATKLARDGSQQELRLLPQPIYRYAAPQDKIRDGALFVFVEGTDPELFVLLEARSDADAPRWMFAAARMNSAGFRLAYQQQEVWAREIMPWAGVTSHAEIYTTFMHKMP